MAITNKIETPLKAIFFDAVGTLFYLAKSVGYHLRARRRRDLLQAFFGKVDVISFQNRASTPKKIAHLIWITAAVDSGIYFEKHFAARLQMVREIIHKEVPFIHGPNAALAIRVEAGRERGDQIECAPEIGQRLEGINFPDLSLDPEKVDQFIKKPILAGIDSETVMPELLANEEKESAAAPKVDNLLRRQPVQL